MLGGNGQKFNPVTKASVLSKCYLKIHFEDISQLVSVTARSKAWVCGRSLAGITGSNSTGGHGCLSLVNVVCCQVEVSASGQSLVQRSRIECRVSECDRESSTLRRLGPLGAAAPWGKNVIPRRLG